MKTILCSVIGCQKILLGRDQYFYNKGLKSIQEEGPVYKCKRCNKIFGPKFYNKKFRQKNPTPNQGKFTWTPKYK